MARLRAESEVVGKSRGLKSRARSKVGHMKSSLGRMAKVSPLQALKARLSPKKVSPKKVSFSRSLAGGSKSVGASWAIKIGVGNIPILNQFNSFDEFYKAAATEPFAWDLYNKLYNTGKLDLVQDAYAKGLLPRKF